MAAKLESIKVVVETDEDPDLSWIGSYSNNPGRESCTIDRKERGCQDRGTYRYFIATLDGIQTGNPESVERDFQRMEAYNSQQWGMVGLWVEASIRTQNGITQTIRSGGLWGIETDCGQDYLASIVKDEMATLREELKALGVKVPKVATIAPDRDDFIHAPLEA